MNAMPRLQRKAGFYSMTGYAVSEVVFFDQLLRLEIKTLNHRHLDIKIRSPKAFSSFEVRIRQMLQSKIGRGSIDCRLDLNQNPESAHPLFEANLSVAASYFESLRTLQKTLGLTDSISTQDLLRFPDVITRKGTEALEEKNPDALWQEVEPRLLAVLDQVLKHRLEEGEALLKSLENQLNQISACSKAISQRRSEWQKIQKQKIRQKLDNLFETYPLLKNQPQAQELLLETRLAQELALLLERSDFDEELTRLDGHIQKVKKTFADLSPAGRQLEFLMQEMHREINTLGNKAQDLPIHEITVQMKVLLEQMREQVMNIE